MPRRTLEAGQRVEVVHTYCSQCRSRCGVLCTVEDGVLKAVEPDDGHPNACICVKGTAAPELILAPDRLRFPLRRTQPKGARDPGWERISWDHALDLIATRLTDIKNRFGPEAVVFGRPAPYGSPAADFVEWLHRLANTFGSPNVMATTHICNWGRDRGSSYTYGVGIPTPDFDHARCILLWGYNPHVSCLSDAMRVSRAGRRGARVIVVDPRRSGAAGSADLWLRVRPGSDGALALAAIHVLLSEGLYDGAFARRWSNGTLLVRSDNGQLLTHRDLAADGDPDCYFAWDLAGDRLVGYRAAHGYERDGAEASLFGAFTVKLASGREVACHTALETLRNLALRYAPEVSERITWVPAGDVYEAVRLFATQKPSCYCTLVGLEEHSNAMQTNRAIALFYALTGQFDTRGSNAILLNPPVNPIEGREFLPRQAAARRLGLAARPLGPAFRPGSVQAYDVYDAILTSRPYPVRAMAMFGGNPLLSNGDSVRGKQALEALDFYVQADIFLNPSSILADVVLPTCTAWESEAVRTTFEGAEETRTWLQLRKAVVPPLHESRSDIEIIFQLATRLGLGDRFWGGDVKAAFDYQLQPSGVTVESLRANPLGVRVPVLTRFKKYAEVDEATGRPRGFETASRKVEVYSIPFAKHGYPALPVYEEPGLSPFSRPDLAAEFPLVLTMSKLLHYTHTSFRNLPSLRRQVPHPFLEIHPQTAQELGIGNGDWVDLETPSGSIRVKARFTPWLHPKVVCTQHGWWQDCPPLGLPGYDPFGPDGANANLLISNEVRDRISGSISNRSYLCRVRRAGSQGIDATAAAPAAHGSLCERRDG